jgi:uncharacterized membrane protein (DUF485 family)
MSNGSSAYLVLNEQITPELNNTEFEIIISDGEHNLTKDALLLVIDHDIQPSSTVWTTSTSSISLSVEIPFPTVIPTNPNFFNTPLGTAIVVVGSATVLVTCICCFFVCISIFGYQYCRKKREIYNVHVVQQKGGIHVDPDVLLNPLYQEHNARNEQPLNHDYEEIDINNIKTT